MNTEIKITNPLTGASLVIAPRRDLVAAFTTEESVDAVVADIRAKAKAAAEAFDVSTPTGRTKIISVAARVAKSKVALDTAGKELNAEKNKQIKAVDAGRRKIREQLDDLRDEIRKPVTDWEAVEEMRVDGLKARLVELSTLMTSDSGSEIIKTKVDLVAAIKIDDTWQEYQGEAAILKGKTLEALRNFLELAQSREAMEKELAERRAADIERDRLDAFEAMQAQAEGENKEFDQAIVDAEIAAAERSERARRDVEAAAAEATKVAEKKHAEELRQIEVKAQQERTATKGEAAMRKRLQEARDRDGKLLEAARASIFESIKDLKRSQVVEALLNNEIPHVKFTV